LVPISAQTTSVGDERVAFPDFIISPSLALVRWARELHQSRRKVKLTVHRADLIRSFALVGDDVIGS
jgi:hypothetical protein